MNAADVVRRLHQHRIWANHQLLATVATLPDEALRQTFAIGQGSIWKSLTHLYAAEYVWLESLLGDEAPLAPGDVVGKLPGNQEGPNPIPNFERLRTDWSALDARWQKYLTDLQPEALDRTVIKLATAGKLAGQRLKTSCLDILLHICTHAQYTTAQVVNMLRQAGVASMPDVMLISMARSETAGR
jgi:uncharacterized damage-inducible protein DinB